MQRTLNLLKNKASNGWVVLSTAQTPPLQLRTVSPQCNSHNFMGSQCRSAIVRELHRQLWYKPVVALHNSGNNWHYRPWKNQLLLNQSRVVLRNGHHYEAMVIFVIWLGGLNLLLLWNKPAKQDGRSLRWLVWDKYLMWWNGGLYGDYYHLRNMYNTLALHARDACSTGFITHLCINHDQ